MADGKVVYEIRGDNSGFQSDVNQTEQIARSKTSSIGGFAKAAIVGVGAAVAAVGAGIVSFSKDAIGVGSNFDAAMSQVAATMGVTADEIGNLRDFAMEMGSTTAFSATEAAEALNYMALAGYDAETSMKMLPNVLNLAAAGNMSLARASDMVTDAQTALGLTLPETEKLVDKMAKTSSKTNTSVEQLGDAILTVGGTAKSLKGGTTELATVLGVLADNGIKGAEGGTALRNVILALSAPTDKAAEKLEELGVAAYDADGNMRALPDIFSDLNKAMDGMTQGQKTDVLNTIFNKVDLKAANALLGTSVDRFNELQGAIDSATGAAEKMANTQLDNLTGDITLMKSALEGAKITLSNALTPALRSFVQMGTREITKLDNAFKKGGINGFADQLGKSLSTAVTKLISYTPKIVSAAITLAKSLIASILSYLTKNLSKIIQVGGDMIKNLAEGARTAIPKLFSAIGQLIGQTIADTPKMIEIGWAIIEGILEGIVKGIPELVKGFAKGLKGSISNPVAEEVEASKTRLEEFREEMANVGLDATELGKKLSDSLAGSKEAEYWLDVFDRLKDKTSLTKDEQILLNTAVSKLNELIPDLGLKLDEETGKWSLSTGEIRKNIDALKDRAKAEVYYEQIQEHMRTIVDLERQMGDETVAIDKLTTKSKNLNAKLKVIEGGYQDCKNALASWSTTVDGFTVLNSELNGSWDAGTAAMRAMAAQVGITQENFVTWEDTLKAVDDGYNKLKGDLATTDAQISEHKGKLKEIETAYERVTAEVDQLANAAAAAEAHGRAVGEGFARGLRGSTTVVTSAAGSLASAALNRMKSVALIASPSKKARREVGEQIGKGEALGLEDSIPDVKKASEKLINAIEFDVPTIDAPTVTASGENDTRINAIIAVLNRYLPRIGAPIVLDTGELVGATVEKYDYELGVLQQRRARYE